MTYTTQTTKAKTVLDDMPSRRIFTSSADALAYLAQCAKEYSDFASIPFATPGIDAEGNFDPAIYVDGMNIAVAKLRTQKTGTEKSKIKAIVVAPFPSLDMILANDSGKTWIKAIIEKEQNHLAVRALRDAADISTVVDQMPTTLEAYITSGREGGTGIMKTFDDMFKVLNSTMAKNIGVWAKAKLTKGELKKAMESVGYAAEYYPALESYRDKSLFESALSLGIAGAKKKGLDPTIFERWLETRKTKAFTPGETEEDFDLDDSLAELLKEEDEADAETAETEPAA